MWERELDFRRNRGLTPWQRGLRYARANSSAGFAIFVAVVLLLMWCWFLWNSGGALGVCNGTRVSGWSGGHYTELCIENGTITR